MKMRVALAISLFLSLSLAFAQKSYWYQGTFGGALEKAKQEGKLILVDCFADN